MQLAQLLKRTSRAMAPGSGLGRFDTWRRDLLGCLPYALRKHLGSADNRVELVLDAGGGAELRQVRGGEEERLETLIHPERAVIARALAGSGLPLVVVVRAAEVLRRRVRFPAQVKDNLDRVLGYEMDRLTPFDPQQVFFDHRLLPTPATGQLDVELALIPRSRIEPWIAAAGAADTLKSITWPGAWPGANLLPAGLRRRGRRSARYLTGLTWLLVTVLLLAVLATPLVQKRRIVIDLGERLAQARAQAEQVLALRQRLDKEAASANLVVEQKEAAFHMIELLRRLTELIPDDTWVNQMSVRNNRVELRGESGSATALIEELANEPAFRNTLFKSPVVGIRNTDRERFHLELELVPGAER